MKKERVYFQPKYSKKITDFIVDKIEGGMSLAEICREYGPPKNDVMPIEKTCYRWKKKYPEFKKALDEGYHTLIFKFMDEMNDLSKKVLILAQEIRDAESEDLRELVVKLKAQMDAYKLRHKSLEFMLTRIAPKLVPDLKETPKQTAIDSLPRINIISYCEPSVRQLTKVIVDGTDS